MEILDQILHLIISSLFITIVLKNFQIIFYKYALTFQVIFAIIYQALLIFVILICCEVIKQQMSNSVLPRKNQKIQNLSFQLILINFTAPKELLPQGSNLKLSITRGRQVFEQTKNIPIQSNQGTVFLNRTRLNFMVFGYDVNKTHDFILKINLNLMGEQRCIGECLIDCNSYAQVFLSNQNGAFQETLYISPEEKIQTELYVEKNRFALEKLVKQMTGPKSKSNITTQAHTFQRITDKTFKLGQQLSLSPQRSRSRQNPYKKNSPKKLRQQEKSPARVRQQFVKGLQIHISPHYSMTSKRQSIVKEEPIIKQKSAPIQEPVVKQETFPIKQVAPKQQIVHKQSQSVRQQVVFKQQAVLKKPLIQKQQQVSKPFQVLVDNTQGSVQVINETQVPQTQVIILQEQIPTQTIKQIQSFPVTIPQHAPQVPINIQSKKIVIQQMKVTQSESPFVKSQFKVQQAANLLKTQYPNSTADQQIKINDKKKYKSQEETDKPTLHSINDESAKKHPIKQQEQSRFDMLQEKKLTSEQIQKDQDRLVIKRVSIFKTMSFKLKILLSFLAILFLLGSNYVQENDAGVIVPNTQIQTNNNTIIQEPVVENIKKPKNNKKSIKTKNNPKPIQTIQETTIVQEQINLNTKQKVNKKKGKVSKSK